MEKYDQFFKYIYPQVQNLPRSHGRFRDKFLDAILRVPGEIYLCAKVGQISKLNTLDSTLAEVRWFLRSSSDDSFKLITKKQQENAELMLFEIGSMVNSWKNKLK